ncbi:uncharacterized protein LOC132615501 [Lycium barbarum]|uniref:uncharacterized protein LOC132615501 n=1 Tax=Lycium barbarum TaxID=112863 RepID=UPI00293E4D7B|nr:uncharacterized protein LOC132615501 [Lycium barbarum]
MSHSLIEEYDAKLKVKEEESAEGEHEVDDQEEEDNDDDCEVELVDANDEEFSFVSGVLTSPIAAEEAFDNGHIRPFFPLFNRDLLLSDIDFQHLKNNRLPPDDKVFVETEDNNNNNNPPTTSNEEEISGPYCEWSKKATNKKSNSTGFSKLWRFRDFINRSNSDGRDAFVFLNNPTTSSSSSNVVKKEDKVLEKKGKISTGVEVQATKVITQTNKKKIKKSEAVLAHEAYMKSRARDKERRRSYRPDPFGFFTNVNGGLTRNVHPF